MNNYLKISAKKIITYLLIVFTSLFALSFIANIFWNQKDIINYNFKAEWNSAYIKSDKSRLSELLSTPWIQGEVNKTDGVCKEKWFYKEWNFEYFCNDNTIIAFKQEEFAKVINRTTQANNILLLLSTSLLLSIVIILLSPKILFLWKIRSQISQDELESVYERRWNAINDHLLAENIEDLFNNYIEIAYLSLKEDKKRYKSIVTNHIILLNKKAKDENVFSLYKSYFKRLNEIISPIKIHYNFIVVALLAFMFYVNTNTLNAFINNELLANILKDINNTLNNVFIINTSSVNSIISSIIWKVIIILTFFRIFR